MLKYTIGGSWAEPLRAGTQGKFDQCVSSSCSSLPGALSDSFQWSLSPSTDSACDAHMSRSTTSDSGTSSGTELKQCFRLNLKSSHSFEGGRRQTKSAVVVRDQNTTQNVAQKLRKPPKKCNSTNLVNLALHFRQKLNSTRERFVTKNANKVTQQKQQTRCQSMTLLSSAPPPPPPPPIQSVKEVGAQQVCLLLPPVIRRPMSRCNALTSAMLPPSSKTSVPAATTRHAQTVTSASSVERTNNTSLNGNGIGSGSWPRRISSTSTAKWQKPDFPMKKASPNVIFVMPVSAIHAADPCLPITSNVNRFSTSSSSSSGSAGSVEQRAPPPVNCNSTPVTFQLAGVSTTIASNPAPLDAQALVGLLISESQLAAHFHQNNSNNNNSVPSLVTLKHSPNTSTCFQLSQASSSVLGNDGSATITRRHRKLRQLDGNQRIRTAQKFPPSPPPPPATVGMSVTSQPSVHARLAPSSQLSSLQQQASPVRQKSSRIEDPHTASTTTTTTTPTTSTKKSTRLSIPSNKNNTNRDSQVIINGTTSPSVSITAAPSVSGCHDSTTLRALACQTGGITLLNNAVVPIQQQQKLNGACSTDQYERVAYTRLPQLTRHEQANKITRNGKTTRATRFSQSNGINEALLNCVQPVTQSLDEIIASSKRCAAVDDDFAAPLGRERNIDSPTPKNMSNDDGSVQMTTITNGTVVVRVSSDSLRRANLRITGGADCVHPAVISKISPSASIALNVGDQLLRINGLEVDRWTQTEVATFMCQLCDKSADTVFTIRPNVYRLVIDVEEDCSAQKLASTMLDNVALHVADTVPRSDKLAESMAILKRALDAGAVGTLFEQVYRKRPGLSMDASHSTENAAKNRYRDVCPYDATRVRLRNSPTGDYINANHVNMHIQSSGIINRYIATQGPLRHTTTDFWWMVWENNSTTIVMLTTLMEKGRVKCYQYWPEHATVAGKVPLTMDCGNLELSAVGERIAVHCHYREIALRHKVSGERRLITQMQYTAWPDHGVPENFEHFTRFVEEVRAIRQGSIEPIIVHCSAGIGRTGVLIMMETAACMIEANEPVYPLDIMRAMRDQRAMLIQTVEQFDFVCRSILRGFGENNVEPLAEYQRNRNVDTKSKAIGTSI